MKLNSLLLVSSLLLGAGAANARRDVNVHIDLKDLRDGPVTVEAGRTQEGDVVARGTVTVAGTLNGDCVSIEGSVAVPGKVHGDVASLAGSVSVPGEVTGDVASMGGYVTIDGHVHGDVSAMGGDVTLGPKARVNGSLSLMGGRLHKDPKAQVDGSISQVDLGIGRALASLASKLGKGAPGAFAVEEAHEQARRAAPFAALAVLAGLCFVLVLCAALASRPLEAVAAAARADLWTCAGVGFLMLLAFAPALLLMVVSVIGILLIPLAVLAFALAKLVGLAAFSTLVAERFCQALKRPAPGVLGAVLIGFPLLVSPLVVGKLLRMAGAGFFGGALVFADVMLLAFATMTGLGAVWLTRFGTKKS